MFTKIVCQMTNSVIKSYVPTVVGSEYETILNAPSVGKAKYEYWLTVRDCFPDLRFTGIRARIYGSGEPYSSENTQCWSDEESCFFIETKYT